MAGFLQAPVGFPPSPFARVFPALVSRQALCPGFPPSHRPGFPAKPFSPSPWPGLPANPLAWASRQALPAKPLAWVSRQTVVLGRHAIVSWGGVGR
eukprot:scaffold42173_cov90-Isochrysis_galbana.AAC.1